uniref:Uncharacterized protein n=1 Tax=Romanomermis culicivorax TaxID=13658 RepID=A0A915JTS1_ROMCU
MLTAPAQHVPPVAAITSPAVEVTNFDVDISIINESPVTLGLLQQPPKVSILCKVELPFSGLVIDFLDDESASSNKKEE